MEIRLGKVTQALPLEVELNNDTASAPARAPRGVTLAVGDEVLCALVANRRLVIWA